MTNPKKKEMNEEMELSEITATPQSEAVADSLRRLIGLGIYGTDDRLPSERSLAAQFGVGRMTLRAAIRELNLEGLVKTTRGRSGGTIISNRTSSKLYRKDFLQRCNRELQENYEFRQAVEPLAALLCAERATKAQKNEIVQITEQMPTSFNEYRKLDSRFHAMLANYCDNRLVSEAVHNARTQFFLWADPLWMDNGKISEAMSKNLSQHNAIAKAIYYGKTTNAWNEMITHLHDAEASFNQKMEQLIKKSPRNKKN